MKNFNDLTYRQRKDFALEHGLTIGGTWQPQAQRIYEAILEERERIVELLTVKIKVDKDRWVNYYNKKFESPELGER